MDRSAPEGGYNFGNKRQYRRNVWATARRCCNAHDISQAQILLMPSIEGKEIEVAENNGFRQCNMHVVDQNPAIVAHLKRRYPHITTYGVDIVAALKRIAKAGIRLTVANFDFCSTAPKIKPIISEIARLPVFADYHYVFITCQRGRDRDIVILAKDVATRPKEFSHLAETVKKGAEKGFSARDTLRAETLFGALCVDEEWITRVLTGVRVYRSHSGHITMMYFGVWRIKYTEKRYQWWVARDKRKALEREEQKKKELIQSCIGNMTLH